MPKLNDFAAEKSKFKTDEDAINYFYLVELYEKHLTGKQKEDFLGANTIDGMLDVLDEKQLEHLRSLLGAHFEQAVKANKNPEFCKKAYSPWFMENVIEKKPKFEYQKLISRIYNKQIKKTEVKNLVSKFNSRLKKFDGDLEEYCQWLILLSIDNSIPSIESVYNVHKLLKPLDLRRLCDIHAKLTPLGPDDIVSNMKRLEPYFYWIATEDLHGNYDKQSSDIRDWLFNGVESSFVESNRSPVHAIFGKERIKLNNKITELINEKVAIAESTIAKLGTSKTFEDSLMKVADLVGGDDEVFLREAIGEYSKIGAYGDAFNRYLRKAIFLADLSKGKFSSDELKTFRKRFAQASEYFMRHLTDKEYTVYRGVRADGLQALLDKSTPKINYKTNKPYNTLIIDTALINEIKIKKPVVFDEGFVSTSLNKGVSSCFFNGTGKGNVLFTIKIPPHSKALVLDYEGIRNVPDEEEVLLAARTKMKIKSMKEVDGHYEIEAEVIN